MEQIQNKRFTKETLRHYIGEILISGYELETKTENILKLFESYSPNGVIIGWIDVRVNPPEENIYINVCYNNNTRAFERLATKEFIITLRQKDAKWQPFLS